MIQIDAKDKIEILLIVWANIVATLSLIAQLKDKNKTAKRRGRKTKRKR